MPGSDPRLPRSDIHFHPFVAAMYDPVQLYFERYQAPEHREYLARGLAGAVLEIAAGTGAMLPYYEAHADRRVRLHGVEPDPTMWHQLRDKLATRSADMSVVCGRAESLPYDADTFDYVVECGLFCTVPSIRSALSEIHRVLKPGGEFRFLDHVRSDGLVGRTQDWLTPLWRRIGGNCHLDREIAPEISGF